MRPRRRRPIGEPKRLLLEAAVELFNDFGYEAATREIAARAGVSETLLFRHFGNKAGLFRAAMVTPFVEFVDRFAEEHADGLRPGDDPVEVAVAFVGELYDVFMAHRALVTTLWSATTHTSSDLAESGFFDDVWLALDKLTQIGKRASAGRPARNEIATRAILSMIAGMAVATAAFKDAQIPERAAVVEEMAMISLYGRMRVGGDMTPAGD